MASTTWDSSKPSEPSITGTKPTRTPSRITCASRLAVPSVSHSASRPSGRDTRTPLSYAPGLTRCASTPRSRSASTTRRALFSSIPEIYLLTAFSGRSGVIGTPIATFSPLNGGTLRCGRDGDTGSGGAQLVSRGYRAGADGGPSQPAHCGGGLHGRSARPGAAAGAAPG